MMKWWFATNCVGAGMSFILLIDDIATSKIGWALVMLGCFLMNLTAAIINWGRM